MEDLLKISGVFSQYSTLFSNNLFCELYLLWLTGLAIPYLHLTVCTEFHLGSVSLCCGLKSLSRDDYLNCLMSSFLKTTATYMLFVCFLFIREDKSNLCHFILTQMWRSPKCFFFFSKNVSCLHWVGCSKSHNGYINRLCLFVFVFFAFGYLYLMLIINSYFPISPYAPSDSYPGKRYLIQNHNIVK